MIPAGEAAVEDRREVEPHGVRLAMVDPVDEDHSAKGTALLRPLAEDARKVADVVRHEDASVACRHREHLVVVEVLQRRLAVERPRLMARRLQPLPDRGP